jgi:predicted amidohydrolase
MKTIRVAAANMNGYLGGPQRALKRIEGWCEHATAQEVELALFAELIIHGHCTLDTLALAEAVPDGPSTQRLIQLARQHRLFVRAGRAERERDIVYDTQLLVGPEGRLGRQRKLHMSRDEVLHYRGGQSGVRPFGAALRTPSFNCWRYSTSTTKPDLGHGGVGRRQSQSKRRGI